jgi:DNA-binding MarR family transcriptional regulator
VPRYNRREAHSDLAAKEYRAMAEFRYQVRCFLRFSELEARRAGIQPQQYLLMLAVKGLAPGVKPTIRTLSERLQIEHHSTVELVDRSVERGLVVRQGNPGDRRHVVVNLTAAGEKLLRRLALRHRRELGSLGVAMRRALADLVKTLPQPDEISGGS